MRCPAASCTRMLRLEPAGQIPTAPPDDLPEALVDVPAVNQHVRAGVRQGFEAFQHFGRQIDLAAKREPLLLADRLLDVQLRVERVLAPLDQL